MREEDWGFRERNGERERGGGGRKRDKREQMEAKKGEEECVFLGT